MEKTPEQIAQEAAAAAAAAGQDEQAVVEAAAEAPPAGATEAAQEAVDQAAAAAPPEVKVELEQVKAKLAEYKAAVEKYTKSVRSELSEQDAKLLDTLSEKDPIRWLGLYASLKEAGKIGGGAASAPSAAPEADRSRISADAGKEGAPASVEEARAATMAELERL